MPPNCNLGQRQAVRRKHWRSQQTETEHLVSILPGKSIVKRKKYNNSETENRDGKPKSFTRRYST
eukprot:scaffold106429_cov34-Prasinocladus_malaysianus.AAC.1